ncbi:MAG TPA: membrane dipeptidase [Longimicrobiales bacterium]|nr:membrane dipeptidase [Longimicrobiales bacterium]
MRRHPIVPALAVALVAACSASTPDRPVPRTDDPHLATAYRVLSTTPLIDGHNDLPWAIRGYDEAPMDVAAYDLRRRTPGHTDIARLRRGMVGGQFWSVYVPAGAVSEGAARVQLEQIDIAKRVIARYPDVFELALTPADVERIFAEGKIASMLGMEGGHAIENSLGALRAFYDLGARYMTLTHSANIDWADSCCEDPKLGGLSAFGEVVVGEMNRLGMLVDLSHVSPATMNDVLDIAAAPVIFSHSSARAVTDHPRNVPDQVLRRMPENGGVVMVTYVTVFVNEALRRWSETPREQRAGDPPRSTMADVIAHLEHVRDVAGIDHVGIGSDYDGATTPEGLEDVSTYPALFAELSRRGWSEADLRKLAGENVLRAWRRAEAVAARLRERPASTATIARLDGVVPEGRGAFVTRLGSDTLAVERFRHGPTSFHAEVLLRAPRTRLTVYDADLDAAGNITSLTATEYDPAAITPTSMGEPVGRTTWRYGDGSVTVTSRTGGETRETTIEAPARAIPFIDMVHWPYELALVRGIAARGEEALPMLQGRGTGDFGFVPEGRDRLTLRHPFRGTMAVRRAANRGIATLDAGNTTRALTVDRVEDVPLADLARRYAGSGIGELSGRGEAEGTIGRASLVVDYGVPKKRGREIFGALVPYGEVWRTGANRATHLVTNRDLIIGRTRVPAGTYTLFTIPDRDRWTLIVNRRTDIGGTSYDGSADLARIPMEVRRLSEPVEDFTIVVDPAGFLRLRWDRTEAFVPVAAR